VIVLILIANGEHMTPASSATAGIGALVASCLHIAYRRDSSSQYQQAAVGVFGLRVACKVGAQRSSFRLCCTAGGS